MIRVKNIKIIFLTTIFLMWAGLAQAEKKNKRQAAPPIATIQAKDFSKLDNLSGFSGLLLNNHVKLYQGYVKNTNILLSRLNVLIASKKSNSPEYAELKRRFGWELNGILLHEYYFENLGGKTPIDIKSAFYKKIIQDFGSFDNWKQDFIATGLMRGIGWALVYSEPRTGKLINTWINEHDTGHVTAAKPILVMDVFEHAYMTDYQLDRAKYIEAFFRNINWEAVITRYNLSAAENTISISATEDLMREHGILNRILLIYAEIIRRLDNHEAFPVDVLVKSTAIIQNFIQNYHEKLEENYLFNRFRKANKLVDLVNTLEEQHKAGRKLINDIIVNERILNSKEKNKLAELMRSFIKLYNPHKAREETILFPAFHTIISAQEYNALGDSFEDEEQNLFGENGYEKIVSQIEEIERSLGIYRLSQFTPARYIATNR